MTKYEEICEASENAVKQWDEYRDRCWQYLGTIIKGFKAHCGIPPGKITYLSSNGQPGDERKYSRSEGTPYTLPGAATFEEDDEFWHLGISLTLSPDGEVPERWVSVVLCVSEKNAKPRLKIGRKGKKQEIDFDDAEQCAAIYDEIADVLKQKFDDPRNITKKKQVGFVVLANPKQGEQEEQQ